MTTIIASIIVFVFAALLMGIGFILSGKPLKKGCGLSPDNQNKDQNCPVCGKTASEQCAEKPNDNS